MKNSYVLLLFISIILVSVSSLTIFAEESTIQINTFHDYYLQGDNLVVFGSVNTIVDGEPITLQILYNNTNLVDIAQIPISKDGSFAQIFLLEGNTWKKSGNYTIHSKYHSLNNDIYFNLLSKKDFQKTNIFTFDDENVGTHDLNVSIYGGKINNITIDDFSFGIRIDITAIDDGKILLHLPREWIGATKYPEIEQDEIWIILIDEQQIMYKEIETTVKHRVIEFDFLKGDKEIRIIGTYVGNI